MGPTIGGGVSGLGSRRSQGVVGGAIITSAARMSSKVAADRRGGLRVVARVTAGTSPQGGDTRLGSGFSRISEDVRNQVKKNFTRFPIALFSLLVGFSMCAFFPHPESPGDAPIAFTIIFLCEFLSSVLYSPKRPRGLLKWLKTGKLIPLGREGEIGGGVWGLSS